MTRKQLYSSDIHEKIEWVEHGFLLTNPEPGQQFLFLIETQKHIGKKMAIIPFHVENTKNKDYGAIQNKER